MQIQQARTRAILAALEIPIWAARSELVQSVAVASIWNRKEEHSINQQDKSVDVMQHAVKTDAVLSLMVEPSTSVVLSEPISVHSEAVISTRRAPTDLIINQTQLDIKPIRQPFAQTIVASETVHVVQVLRFSLEARVIGNWVVLVSVQALGHRDRNALWQNINQTFQMDNSSTKTESYRLEWPLSEGIRWQHNVGTQAALMGFLTRFGSERRVGLRGELPDAIIPEHIERLPSLDELLQEPLKKRSLWRLLSGQVR